MSGSLSNGEKWQIQLFTETQVGKAIPVRENNKLILAKADTS